MGEVLKSSTFSAGANDKLKWWVHDTSDLKWIIKNLEFYRFWALWSSLSAYWMADPFTKVLGVQ
jgi:hypothetical protein